MNFIFNSHQHIAPLRRCRGITLIDLSVLLVFLAIALAIGTLEKVRDQSRNYAIAHGLELRQILNAALVHRYHMGEWPLNSCSRLHAVSSRDCNGDGRSDDLDYSGMTALVEAGRLPALPRYIENQARGGEWVALQPWTVASAAVSTRSGLAAVLTSDSLRMETIVQASISRYAGYIARLIPGAQVVEQAGETRLVSIVRFGGYNDILLAQLFPTDVDRDIATVFTDRLVIDRRVVLDAPQPGLLRVRPYLDAAGGSVRINVEGQRLGTATDGAVPIVTSSLSVGSAIPISVDGAAVSTSVTANISPAPALIFGVAALETVGSNSDYGNRVELRALPDRLQIVERLTAGYFDDGITLLRQSSLDDRPALRAVTIDPVTGGLIHTSTGNLQSYFAYPGDYSTQSLVIDAAAAASSAGDLRTEATRTALLLGGIYDHPSGSPAIFPDPATVPAGASDRIRDAREGDARVALGLSVRYYSSGAPRLLGSLRGLLHDQLFLDENPLVYPAGAAALSIQELLDFCTLPALLSISGSTSCGNPADAGAMFTIASQTEDAAMVLPKLSVYFSDEGGFVEIGDGVDGSLELWSDESLSNSSDVVREPGLHQRALFSAAGLSVGDYDSYFNFSDARAPRAARVHLGLAVDTDIYSYAHSSGVQRQVTIEETEATNRSAWPVVLGEITTSTTSLDVIDFGGNTAGGRTPLRLLGAAALEFNMPLGLWYGESNYPVASSGTDIVRGLQIGMLTAQSISHLACWACTASSEGVSCPAPGDSPRYVCP